MKREEAYRVRNDCQAGDAGHYEIDDEQIEQIEL